MVEILKTYYDPIPEYKDHFVVVELKVKGQNIKKKILVDDVLESFLAFPSIGQIPEKKLLKRASEMVVNRLGYKG